MELEVSEFLADSLSWKKRTALSCPEVLLLIFQLFHCPPPPQKKDFEIVADGNEEGSEMRQV